MQYYPAWLEHETGFPTLGGLAESAFESAFESERRRPCLSVAKTTTSTSKYLDSISLLSLMLDSRRHQQVLGSRQRT